MSVARTLAFDPYAESRETGAFILIDRFSNETVAAGMINFAPRHQLAPAASGHEQDQAVAAHAASGRRAPGNLESPE
jgi:bifunctional enzyme CysN/CysC